MNSAATLILARSEVARLAEPADYYEAVAAGFRAYANARTNLPAPMEIGGRDGAFHIKGASMEIDGRRLAAVKVNANFPSNPELRGLPTIQGGILLSDAETGELLAIMDSIEITLRRTAAASAVATDALARKAAETLLICGCGVQGRAHLEAVARLRPFRRVFAYDSDPGKARRFAAEMATAARMPIEATNNVQDAARNSEVIITVTTAASPIPLPSALSPGTFIAAVGADSPAKNEISPSLMARAAVITDVTDQCVAMGDLRAAIAAGAMVRSDVRADLGEVLTGARSGRISDDEVVIFDSTGAAFQDLTTAAMIYGKARAKGAGAWTSLQQ